jgi:hypothetical protein
LLLRAGDVLTSMQERREFGAVVPLSSERVGLEYSFESPMRVTCSIPDFGEMFKVAGYVAFVPGDRDGFDVGKVLVQRGTSDTGVLSDPGHGHRCQTVRGHQRRRGVQGRVANRVAVRLDRSFHSFGTSAVYGPDSLFGP